MRRSYLLTLLAVFLVAASALFWAVDLDSDEDKFLAECEKGLKSRLKSPSTYKRITVHGPFFSDADLNDYMGESDEEVRRWKKESIRKAGPNSPQEKIRQFEISNFRFGEFQVAKYTIEYDASNSFGTPIRSLSTCSQVVKKETPIKFEEGSKDILIDGVSAMDWALFELWKLVGSQ